jgi:hypothetical protein
MRNDTASLDQSNSFHPAAAYATALPGPTRLTSPHTLHTTPHHSTTRHTAGRGRAGQGRCRLDLIRHDTAFPQANQPLPARLAVQRMPRHDAELFALDHPKSFTSPHHTTSHRTAPHRATGHDTTRQGMAGNGLTWHDMARHGIHETPGNRTIRYCFSRSPC